MLFGLTAKTTHGDAASDADDDEEKTSQDVAGSRQPESVPIQRRVAVRRVTGIVRGELSVRPVYPDVSCTHATRC